MTRARAVALIVSAVALVSLARGGHELPIYPSYYPHEIEIRTIAPDRAAAALREATIHAFVGPGLSFADPPPADLRAIETLGSFVVVGINPQSALAQDETSACAAVRTVIRALATQADFIAHPYPVTPLHGDYLHHADLAAAAAARLADGDAPPRALKVKASGRLRAPGWSTTAADWDAEITEIDVTELVASATSAMNGWLAPPWLRTGWFHAERLLGDAPGDPVEKQRMQANLQRRTSGDFSGLTERINLERDLVTMLTGGCRKLVAGYTRKREYVNVEYSAGIENIGYDALEGLQSPMFVRTVKLKDYPWNGSLAVGIGGAPTAAWNPIGGMNDPFGRFVAFTIGDPALLPSPYEAGWMLNRIADLPSNPGR